MRLLLPLMALFAATTISAKETPVPLEPSPVVEARFATAVDGQPIQFAPEWPYFLLDALQSTTRFKTYKRKSLGDTYIEQGLVFQPNKTPNGFDLVYFSHDVGLSSGIGPFNRLRIPWTITQEPDGQALKVRASLGDLATLEVKKTLMFGAPKLDMDLAKQDAAYLITKLPTLRVKAALDVVGELTTNFPQDSVLANFERMAGAPLPRSSVEDHRSHVIEVDGMKHEVAVRAFPYRDGSKLEYVARVEVEVVGDGSVTGADRASKLVERIMAIANN